jgi:hypothetical protein
MRIVLERIIPVELSCILYNLCNLAHYMPLSELSRRVSNIFSTINVDRCNKTPELTYFDKLGRLYLSVKAVQAWALPTYLPLAMGDCIPTDNPHWLLLLHLSKLVNMLFSPCFTEGMICFIRDFTLDHLHILLDLYSQGETAVKVKPKHHLLLHLPSVILASGPLLGPTVCGRLSTNAFCGRNVFQALCPHKV